MRIALKIFLILLAGSVFTCCFLPSIVFRLQYGREPLSIELYNKSFDLIKEGMTFDEVRAVYGEPHEKHPNNPQVGGEDWIYWTSTLKIGYLGIMFGPDGRVTGTWI